ncbi:metallophosphoesterase family protein [Daejeonella sp. H1SJ63]|uniref:metallophosphoesterase family protein n=1 Tax=Daejeonella sp. H1SJ63 TaxID=3034145 RepID=UPI0023ED1E4E|nr:metallophosphoesterase family protein [Daejeonella sp. H1SJ63]
MKLRLSAIPAVLSLFLLFSSFISTGNGQSYNHRPKDPSGIPEKKHKTLRICVISDLNSSYGSTTYSNDVKALIKDLSSIKPDIIVCGGDMVAGQKATLTEENINAMWAAFKSTVLDPIQNLKIPFGFTVGNHDASPSYIKDRKLSRKFWIDNAESTGLSFVDSTHYPFYYSYIKDKVFFMSWDAAGAQISPEVFDWMKMQLNAKTARKAKLRILTGHLPLYAITESKNKAGEVNSDPEAALKFFKANGLDLYISGHQHAYYPAEKEGIRFLNAGAIGDGPRKLIGNDTPPRKSYTLIDVPLKRADQFRYRTFVPQSNIEIDLSSLPDSVIGFNGVSRLEKLNHK